MTHSASSGQAYARIRHDRETIRDCGTGQFVPNARQNDACWQFGKTISFPAVHGISATPAPNAGNAPRYTPAWFAFLKELNFRFGDPRAWTGEGDKKGIRRNNAGLFNWASNKEWGQGEVIPENPDPYPIAETVVTVGNYVKVLERKNGASRIAAWHIRQTPPSLDDFNPIKTPWMFDKFTSIAPDGSLGNAPDGFLCYFPRLVREEKNGVAQAWLPDEILEFGVELPKEQPIMRAHGVDIHYWTGKYSDDGIDEGFNIDFVIQKVADGATDYTAQQWQKDQYASVKHFGILGGFHWFQTEMDGKAQAGVLLAIDKKELYDFFAVDYESYLNEITQATALKLRDYILAFRAGSSTKLILYTNLWIYLKLVEWLGQAFVDSLDFWFAGGTYYNQERTTPLPDNIQPSVQTWKIWQYSADGNRAADELDFGTNETASIDLDVFNGTVTDMLVWLGKVDEPPPPPDGFDKQFVIGLANEIKTRADTIIGYVEGQ